MTPPSAPGPFNGAALQSAIEALRNLEDQSPERTTASPEQIKGCCAAVYGLDLLSEFLGDSYHPGGMGLTRHLADALDLQAGQQVLDLASGLGSSALLLAAERDVEVTAIDLGTVQVAKAQARAVELGLDGQVRFEVADAERLPMEDGCFDAVICECAFCTFPDKRAAACEIARVLRAGGKVGISDVWLEPDRLEPELAGLAGRVACLADARPVDEVKRILASSGLRVTATELHNQALAIIIERIRAGIKALKIVGGLDRELAARAISLTDKAAQVVARGHAGYFLLVARYP
jgi:ubiquinone/menaquinone biosynthesis C-methylase UbiE